MGELHASTCFAMTSNRTDDPRLRQIQYFHVVAYLVACGA